jgi:Tol biopolymer transport system component
VLGSEGDRPKSSREVDSSGRLESWKEIATYLKREVRTVQRWEKEEGLPIHRQMHKSLGTIYAFKSELDAWWNNGRHRFGTQETVVVSDAHLREVTAAEPGSERTESKSSKIWLAAAGAAIIFGASIYVYQSLRSPLPPPRITGYEQLTGDGQSKWAPLLTDGSRLYFDEVSPVRPPTLMSVAVTGGDPTPIKIPFRDFVLLAISPRRSELLIGTPTPGTTSRALWTLPLAGGTPRRFGKLFAYYSSWSPDGESLAYSQKGQLFMAKGDGTNSSKIATFRGEIKSLSWSPDGRKLRLLVEAPDRDITQFWDIGADGSGLQRVLTNWQQFSPAGEWTPDSRYFLYLSTFEFGGKSVLWAWPERIGFFRRTDVKPIRLDPAGPLSVATHTLSPDGKKIFLIGVQRRPQLARYDAALHEFVPFLGGIPAEWVTFSRDAKSVAYLSLPQQTLWRAKSDGSEPVQLTFAPLRGDGLAWSPDGKTIALRAQMPGKPWKIYLIPAEGGAPEMLTPGTQDEGVPTWSADGKQIVFGDVPANFGQDDGHHALHVINVQTRAQSDLPGSQGLWTSRWSPDGRYIVAQTITTQYLRLFDLKTRKWSKLADVQTDNPTWSRDGVFVQFDNPVSLEMYRVRIKDGAIEEIIGLEKNGQSPVWRCGLAIDNSPLVTLESGFTEIYALDWEAP